MKVIQLIVGSYKSQSVNGINNSIRMRNLELEGLSFQIHNLRIDGIKGLLNGLKNMKKCDFIFIDSFYNINSILIALIAKILFRSEVIIWSHGAFNIYKYEIKKKLYSLIVFKIIKKHYLVTGKSEMEFISKRNIRKILIGNGVLIPEVINNPPEVQNYILYMGRFDIVGKGIDRIWDFLRRHELENLLMFGKGEEIIVPIDLKNRVKISSPIFDNEKTEVIQKAKALILLSRREGVPIICLESLMLGTPIIISPECNIPYGYGILSPESEIKEFNRDRIRKNARLEYDIVEKCKTIKCLIDDIQKEN